MAPQSVLFPVPGNHDIVHPSRAEGADSCRNYTAFQSRLLERAKERGYEIACAPDGRAYAVQIGTVDVIGLQCVTTGRRFSFPEGIQLDWLERHLEETEASWHILLCHAPLLKHNPHRNEGVPYLDQNRRLQESVDRNGRILFLNGHTHVSPNGLDGNGEYDEEHQNIYLDCGSVVATDTSGETGLMAPDWKDGCKTELVITRDTIEICMRSVTSGVGFPRGYYRFQIPEHRAERGT